MAIHIALHHKTSYQYDRPIQIDPQIIRLRPAPHCRGKIISYSLMIEPAEHFINWQQDPFANYQARLVFPKKSNKFNVTVDLVAEMAVYNPFDFFLEPEAEKFPFKYHDNIKKELTPYLSKPKEGTLFAKYFQLSQSKMRRLIF
jgi:transglutaminase-like putative cysteine protease